MNEDTEGVEEAMSPNRFGPMRFVLVFGVVSGLADFVYEGARSIVGPYLETFGASAALVGAITGFGEAVALVFRLATGRWSDRTGRHWAISFAGYAITVVSVPLLGVGGPLAVACVLVVAERFGKAVRTPARDTMLAQASVDLGRGRAFAAHEALDQSGALVGPLVVAAVLALGGGYRSAFAVLAVPGVAALGVLVYLRRRVPEPGAYDPAARPTQTRSVSLRGFGRRFWQYATFSAATLAGFSTFAVLAYHLQHRHVVSAPVIPVLYAVAMGAAALTALASGRVYDRFGLRGLLALPVLGTAIPFLSFSTDVALVWVGALLWGAVMGIHESTMRAAVADLVPPERRGVGYGTFTAVYGLAWLAGSAIIGALYDVSIDDAIIFTVVVQAVAVVAFLPLWKGDRVAAGPEGAGSGSGS
ncbi:MAG TPA: MFS transporter [Acidimicrobiales bacterium]|nr:MFS transporter [Acidimicrobiales bacterium]